MSEKLHTDKDDVKKRIHDNLLCLVDQALADAEIGPRIRKLIDFFGADVDMLKREVLSYTLDGCANEWYQTLVARLALYFHNLVPGTFHKKRHELTLSFLQKTGADKLMDIGYGVPGPYLLSYLKDHPEATAILADRDKTAEEFSRGVLLTENPRLLKRINFLVYDMNFQTYPGDAQVYVYLDSIEHTERPTEYLQMMVKNASIRSHFIFSLPICSMKGLEGFHFAEWLTDGKARKWVQESGLKIINEGTAYPNPQVDYFMELAENGYHSFLLLTQKTQR